ncbi:hypothetical protein T492DRAFT_1146215 [Pavlovales sp. CCMP2436]|nr:hypothetical protein T492DRAFT_1146215 [Pavlovales sp. CCMP2436]
MEPRGSLARSAELLRRGMAVAALSDGLRAALAALEAGVGAPHRALSAVADGCDLLDELEPISESPDQLAQVVRAFPRALCLLALQQYQAMPGASRVLWLACDLDEGRACEAVVERAVDAWALREPGGACDAAIVAMLHRSVYGAGGAAGAQLRTAEATVRALCRHLGPAEAQLQRSHAVLLSGLSPQTSVQRAPAKVMPALLCALHRLLVVGCAREAGRGPAPPPDTGSGCLPVASLARLEAACAQRAAGGPLISGYLELLHKISPGPTAFGTRELEALGRSLATAEARAALASALGARAGEADDGTAGGEAVGALAAGASLPTVDDGLLGGGLGEGAAAELRARAATALAQLPKTLLAAVENATAASPAAAVSTLAAAVRALETAPSPDDGVDDAPLALVCAALADVLDATGGARSDAGGGAGAAGAVEGGLFDDSATAFAPGAADAAADAALAMCAARGSAGATLAWCRLLGASLQQLTHAASALAHIGVCGSAAESDNSDDGEPGAAGGGRAPKRARTSAVAAARGAAGRARAPWRARACAERRVLRCVGWELEVLSGQPAASRHSAAHRAALLAAAEALAGPGGPGAAARPGSALAAAAAVERALACRRGAARARLAFAAQRAAQRLAAGCACWVSEAVLLSLSSAVGGAAAEGGVHLLPPLLDRGAELLASLAASPSLPSLWALLPAAERAGGARSALLACVHDASAGAAAAPQGEGEAAAAEGATAEAGADAGARAPWRSLLSACAGGAGRGGGGSPAPPPAACVALALLGLARTDDAGTAALCSGGLGAGAKGGGARGTAGLYSELLSLHGAAGARVFAALFPTRARRPQPPGQPPPPGEGARLGVARSRRLFMAALVGQWAELPLQTLGARAPDARRAAAAAADAGGDDDDGALDGGAEAVRVRLRVACSRALAQLRLEECSLLLLAGAPRGRGADASLLRALRACVARWELRPLHLLDAPQLQQLRGARTACEPAARPPSAATAAACAEVARVALCIVAAAASTPAPPAPPRAAARWLLAAAARPAQLASVCAAVRAAPSLVAGVGACLAGAAAAGEAGALDALSAAAADALASCALRAPLRPPADGTRTVDTSEPAAGELGDGDVLGGLVALAFAARSCGCADGWAGRDARVGGADGGAALGAALAGISGRVALALVRARAGAGALGDERDGGLAALCARVAELGGCGGAEAVAIEPRAWPMAVRAPLLCASAALSVRALRGALAAWAPDGGARGAAAGAPPSPGVPALDVAAAAEAVAAHPAACARVLALEAARPGARAGACLALGALGAAGLGGLRDSDAEGAAAGGQARAGKRRRGAADGAADARAPPLAGPCEGAAAGRAFCVSLAHELAALVEALHPRAPPECVRLLLLAAAARSAPRPAAPPGAPPPLLAADVEAAVRLLLAAPLRTSCAAAAGAGEAVSAAGACAELLRAAGAVAAGAWPLAVADEGARALARGCVSRHALALCAAQPAPLGAPLLRLLQQAAGGGGQPRAAAAARELADTLAAAASGAPTGGALGARAEPGELASRLLHASRPARSGALATVRALAWRGAPAAASALGRLCALGEALLGALPAAHSAEAAQALRVALGAATVALARSALVECTAAGAARRAPRARSKRAAPRELLDGAVGRCAALLRRGGDGRQLLSAAEELVVLRTAAQLCEAGSALAAHCNWSAATLAPALATACCARARPLSQALALEALAELARTSPALVSHLLVAHVLPLLDEQRPQNPAAAVSGAIAALVLQLLGSPGVAAEQLECYVALARARGAEGGAEWVHGRGLREEPAWFSRLTPLMV